MKGGRGMKKIVKRAIFFSSLCVFFFSLCSVVYAGTWIQNSDGWYYYGDNTQVKTGWFSDGKGIYYADANGRWEENKKIEDRFEFRREVFEGVEQTVISTLTCIPDVLLNKYFSEKKLIFDIEIEVGDMFERIGTYRTTNQTIYVLNPNDFFTILHEFGHYLDDITGYPSNSEKANEQMNKYGNMFDEYYNSTPQEFFAEAFSSTIAKDSIDYCYFNNAIFDFGKSNEFWTTETDFSTYYEDFRQKCPDLCDYINSVIETIK